MLSQLLCSLSSLTRGDILLQSKFCVFSAKFDVENILSLSRCVSVCVKHLYHSNYFNVVNPIHWIVIAHCSFWFISFQFVSFMSLHWNSSLERLWLFFFFFRCLFINVLAHANTAMQMHSHFVVWPGMNLSFGKNHITNVHTNCSTTNEIQIVFYD